MTCEVVVLNRLGLSLAADSAVTFRSASANGDSTTYSSGANKIFQLTENEPVGLMVYNNATLQGVPWELIVKSYRAKFGDSSCSALNDYKASLATYIEEQEELFPLQHRERETKSLLAQAALLFIRQISLSHPLLLEPSQATDSEWNEFITEVSDTVVQAPLNSIFTDNDIEESKRKYSAWLTNELIEHSTDQTTLQHLKDKLASSNVADLIIEGAYKLFEELFGVNYTGVVFAGYGNNDFFPGFYETKYFGFLDNKLVWIDASSQIVDHNQASAIEAFARQAMVETFLVGAAPSIWQSAQSSFKTHAHKACEEALKKAGANLAPPDLNAVVQNALDGFIRAWRSNASANHYAPLLNVVASLNIEELSELAETLVMLESLKEKVTSRTQSVGGPVDVAIITKSEGLVWIKRKHYFDPALNSRYFSRQCLS